MGISYHLEDETQDKCSSIALLTVQMFSAGGSENSHVRRSRSIWSAETRHSAGESGAKLRRLRERQEPVAPASPAPSFPVLAQAGSWAELSLAYLYLCLTPGPLPRLRHEKWTWVSGPRRDWYRNRQHQDHLSHCFIAVKRHPNQGSL